MNKILIIIAISFLFGCSKTDEDLTTKNSNNEDNSVPGDFEITIKSLSDNSASLSWTESIDPDGDSISYSIYLDQNLIIKNTIDRNYTFSNLKEQTEYDGKITAVDTYNNEITKTFSFKTKKYFLKFLKEYDYPETGTRPIGAPYSMIKTLDNNYLIAGKTNFDDNGYQFLVIKLDYYGKELWKKYYGYQLFDSNRFKITQSTNGYILVGHHHILNLDFEGNLIWHKKIDSYDINDGSAEIKSPKQDANGNIYVVGGRGSSELGIAQEAVLTKLNSEGLVLWEKVYTPSFRNYFEDLIIDQSNQIVILGVTETSGITYDEYIHGPSSVENIDFWVLKVNENGEEIWQQTYGDERHDFSRQIIATQDDNFVIAGNSWGEYDISDRRVIKIDQEGNEMWSNSFRTSSTIIFSVSETPENEFILTGYLDFGDYGALGIFKYDGNGIPEWERLFQEPFTYLRGIAILAEDDGGFRVAANRYKFQYYNGDKPKLLVLKTDPDGNIE